MYEKLWELNSVMFQNYEHMTQKEGGTARGTEWHNKMCNYLGVHKMPRNYELNGRERVKDSLWKKSEH